MTPYIILWGRIRLCLVEILVAALIFRLALNGGDHSLKKIVYFIVRGNGEGVGLFPT